MKKITQFIIASGMMLSASFANAGQSAHILFTANMNGDQEVPAVTTTAMGVATFVLNPGMDTLCFHAAFTNLSGNLSGLHIHEAPFGAGGGVLLDLSGSVMGNSARAIITGADLATILTKLLTGNLYLNAHTAANPNGEVRGQIWLESGKAYLAKLDGTQEVPAVITTAWGLGGFKITQNDSAMYFQVVVKDLSGPITGAHFHMGAVGQSGGAVQVLDPFIMGNMIMGVINPVSFLNDLNEDSIYINIHTTLNPNGEIRGQLMKIGGLIFGGPVDSTQQATAMNAPGRGLLIAYTNAAADTMWYEAAVDTLSGAITAAHFHNAPKGSSGGVSHGIPTGDITGNRISGKITGADLTIGLLNQFLMNEIYLNIHTGNNPNGEVRGQAIRMAHTVHTFPIFSNSIADLITGGGFVSTDEEAGLAHVGFAYDMVSSTITALHLHYGKTGQSGAVLTDLEPMASSDKKSGNGFVYPLSASDWNAIMNDSVYMNVHTTSFPNSEARGDVKTGMDCYDITTSIASVNNHQTAIGVFPNPTIDNISITVNSEININGTVSIVDVLGKQVYTTSIILVNGFNTLPVDLNGFSKGIYTVKVQLNNGIVLIDRVAKN